jgi:hypothetical protein
MANEVSEPSAARLLTYNVASADMFYVEVEQRDVCICDDLSRGFRIWGEMHGGRSVATVDLCQIFLEVALSYQAIPDSDQARYKMGAFGKQIGQVLGQHIKDNPLLEILTNPAVRALRCLLESMNARFTVEWIDNELRFAVDSCPIYKIAELTGLREVVLAHYGFDAMCQSLVYALDPYLIVSTSLETHIGQLVSPANRLLISLSSLYDQGSLCKGKVREESGYPGHLFALDPTYP